MIKIEFSYGFYIFIVLVGLNSQCISPFASALVAVSQSSLDWEELAVLVQPLLVQLVQVDLLVARLRHSLVDVRHLETREIDFIFLQKMSAVVRPI